MQSSQVTTDHLGTGRYDRRPAAATWSKFIHLLLVNTDQQVSHELTQTCQALNELNIMKAGCFENNFIVYKK